MWGLLLFNNIIANFLLDVPVKDFLKVVNILFSFLIKKLR